MSWLLAILAALVYSTSAPLSTSDALANNQHVHTMPEASYTLADLTKEVKHIKCYWERIDKNGPVPQGEHYTGMSACWQWTRPPSTSGYGKMRIGKWHIAPHRIAYMLLFGDVPTGMVVAHRCDNKLCCNPEHLQICTPGDNTRDAVTRGQFPTGDRTGARTHPEKLWRGERARARALACASRGLKNGAYTKPEMVRKGENHGRATLTEDLVLNIRRRYAEGVTISALAKELGVQMPCIGKIVRRLTWRHI